MMTAYFQPILGLFLAGQQLFVSKLTTISILNIPSLTIIKSNTSSFCLMTRASFSNHLTFMLEQKFISLERVQLLNAGISLKILTFSLIWKMCSLSQSHLYSEMSMATRRSWSLNVVQVCDAPLGDLESLNLASYKQITSPAFKIFYSCLFSLYT